MNVTEVIEVKSNLVDHEEKGLFPSITTNVELRSSPVVLTIIKFRQSSQDENQGLSHAMNSDEEFKQTAFFLVNMFKHLDCTAIIHHNYFQNHLILK